MIFAYFIDWRGPQSWNILKNFINLGSVICKKNLNVQLRFLWFFNILIFDASTKRRWGWIKKKILMANLDGAVSDNWNEINRKLMGSVIFIIIKLSSSRKYSSLNFRMKGSVWISNLIAWLNTVPINLPKFFFTPYYILFGPANNLF